MESTTGGWAVRQGRVVSDGRMAERRPGGMDGIGVLNVYTKQSIYVS